MPKKKYEIIKATTRDIPGVYVGGRERRFGKNGTFTVRDAGEAAEIDKVLGKKGTGEVVVTSYDEKEHGHKYTFGASSKFAAAWDAFERRRKRARRERATKKARKTRARENAPEVKRVNGGNI